MDFISYDRVRGKRHHLDSPKRDEICKMFIRTGRRRYG